MKYYEKVKKKFVFGEEMEKGREGIQNGANIN